LLINNKKEKKKGKQNSRIKPNQTFSGPERDIVGTTTLVKHENPALSQGQM
jgi:hypothetical protein